MRAREKTAERQPGLYGPIPANFSNPADVPTVEPRFRKWSPDSKGENDHKGVISKGAPSRSVNVRRSTQRAASMALAVRSAGRLPGSLHCAIGSLPDLVSGEPVHP